MPLALRLQAPEEPGKKARLALATLSAAEPLRHVAALCQAYSIWSLADGDRVPFGALLWVDAAASLHGCMEPRWPAYCQCR